VANHSLPACRRVLTAEGRYVAVGAPSGKWMIGALAGSLAALLVSRFTRKKLLMVMARLKKDDLALTADLMAAGKLTPVIDRRYELSEAAEAVRYLEEGHARGKVIVTARSPAPSSSG